MRQIDGNAYDLGQYKDGERESSQPPKRSCKAPGSTRSTRTCQHTQRVKGRLDYFRKVRPQRRVREKPKDRGMNNDQKTRDSDQSVARR